MKIQKIFILIILLMAGSVMVGRSAGDTVDSASDFERVVYDSIKVLPSQTGFLNLGSTGGMVDFGAWSHFEIDSYEKKPVAVVRAYIKNIIDNLKSRQIDVQSSSLGRESVGLNSVTFYSPGKKRFGTISILASKPKDNKFSITVVSAVTVP